MAHPTVCAILEQIIGPSFRLDHINVHARPGTFPGGNLHGGHNPGSGNGFFSWQNGSSKNGLVSVTFELEDTHCNGGGFACVPGSHKANLNLPQHYRDLNTITEGAENAGRPAVCAVPAAAGDCIIFTEALTHGTLPWTIEHQTRTTLFYKYNANGSAWSANFFEPDDFKGYEDMDDVKLAMLEPPNAR